LSTSIRPGGGVTPGIAPAESEATQASGGIEASSELKASHGVEQAASAVAAGGTAPVNSPSVELLARLDAGELTREQAVEGLVAQALEVHGGARLPAAQRAELESVLRAALEDDPTLAQLLGTSGT
jgi:hypothetical protein